MKVMITKAKILNWWELMQSSFWFVPGVMLSGTIIFAIGLVEIDRALEFGPYQKFLGFLYYVGPEGARSVLSTIAGSMITVAGVVFSITIVALTLASSQFGPRLLRYFMRSRSNQFVLGCFISSFIYCLIVLRSVESYGDIYFVPSMSVNFALLVSLVDVAVLIYFIHHVSSSIQAEYVINEVAEELERRVEKLFPDPYGDDEPDNKIITKEYAIQKSLINKHSGYLQVVDHNFLIKIAKQYDFLITIDYKAGQFVLSDAVLATIESNEEIENALMGEIQKKAFIFGLQRSAEQDPEFAIRQLVEVALRALSPGINDPFTAMACIDRLSAALSFISKRKFPNSELLDDENTLRVVTCSLDFVGMLRAAFDQIRQCSQNNVAVVLCLLESLNALAKQTHNKFYLQAILAQGVMIKNEALVSLVTDDDKGDIEKRFKTLEAACQ